MSQFVEDARDARAKFADWILITFDASEFRKIIADWPAARGILDAIPMGFSPQGFVDAILDKLTRHNLITVELFARIAEARPLCIEALLLGAAEFEAMAPMKDRRAVVQRAIERARHMGAVREMLPVLTALSARIPDISSDVARIEDELRRTRVVIRGSAQAYLEDIQDAVASADLRTATQLLIAYVGEHHSRALARREAESLPPVSHESLPRCQRRHGSA